MTGLHKLVIGTATVVVFPELYAARHLATAARISPAGHAHQVRSHRLLKPARRAISSVSSGASNSLTRGPQPLPSPSCRSQRSPLKACPVRRAGDQHAAEPPTAR